jgi:ABC-type polysaccharide/polyol phosphate transport system ATPase subunit
MSQIDPIIEVRHVTKEFQLGQLQNLKRGVAKVLARMRGGAVPERVPFKALDDVDFNVKPGEVLGIIGQNGAGKSTLLKMLAGISRPSRGTVLVKGKVAPLIEVGAGLVADMTGRENIFLNASILGMSRAQIRTKLDEIISFAELEEFIDTPIKRYSSGMKVRLGFSIATSVDASILIVDEVLAVGDLAFQRKCFDRMEGLIRSQGRTVLLVSHNIRQVERLCSRVLLMSHGRIAQDGVPKQVCNSYYEESDKRIYSSARSAKSGRKATSGDVELVEAAVLDSSGRRIGIIEFGQDIEFRITYRVKRELPESIFGIGVHTTDFLYLATSESVGKLSTGLLSPGTYTVRYLVRKFPFLPGIYSLRLGVALAGSYQPVYYCENVLPLQVASREVSRAVVSGASGEGFVEMNGQWSLEGAKIPDELMTVEAG